MAERQWRNLDEICCDHLALRLTKVEAADYGRVLLKTTIMRPRLKLKNKIPRVAVFYTSQSKQVLKKRLLALERRSLMNPKWILVSFLVVALAGFAIILPWKLTPPINIGVTHYKVFSYDYSNVINSMEVYVEFPFNNIDIKKINVIINNQKTEGRSKSGGGSSAYSSYPPITIPYKRRDPRKIKFLIQTNAGDFQEKYVVDFGRNYSNLEEFFLSF